MSGINGRAFLLLNTAIVVFGVWSLFWPVRQEWRSATAFVWLWIVVETINGIGHPVWSAWQRAYTPGVLTAPFLLVLALSLAFQMLRVSREER